MIRCSLDFVKFVFKTELCKFYDNFVIAVKLRTSTTRITTSSEYSRKLQIIAKDDSALESLTKVNDQKMKRFAVQYKRHNTVQPVQYVTSISTVE